MAQEDLDIALYEVMTKGCPMKSLEVCGRSYKGLQGLVGNLDEPRVPNTRRHISPDGF